MGKNFSYHSFTHSFLIYSSSFHIAIQEILIEPFFVPGAGGTAVSVMEMVLSGNLLAVNEAAHT